MKNSIGRKRMDLQYMSASNDNHKEAVVPVDMKERYCLSPNDFALSTSPLIIEPRTLRKSTVKPCLNPLCVSPSLNL